MTTQTRTRTTLATLLAAGLILLGGVVAAVWFGLFGNVQTNKTVETILSPQQLHQQFVGASVQFLKTTPNQRGAQISSLKHVAQQRQQAMKNLAQTDPQEFLQFAFTKTDRETLPEDIQAFVEQEKEVEGKLRLVHKDYFDQQKSMDEYFVSGPQSQMPVLFAKAPDDKLLGATVKVHGFQLDMNLVASEPDVSLQIIQPAPTVTTTQSYKVAVILINFPNDLDEPLTPEYVRQKIFGLAAREGVAGLYQESSFGQMVLTGKNNNGSIPGSGDVYGWITIPHNSGPCQYTTYGNDARQMLGSALNGYDRYVFVWADESCNFGGIAGGQGSPDVNVNIANGVGGPSNLLPVATHELGHTFGLAHAGATICSPSCRWSEYADPLDPMGLRNSYHFHAGNKQATGWLTSDDVGTIMNSGTYTLTPLEQNASGLGKRGWLFPTTGQSYYLEYRQPSGWDNFLLGSWQVSGVILHKLTLGGFSDFTDTNPETTTLNDGPIIPGETYTDATNGIAFYVPPGGLTAQAATVNATVTCAPANPIVNMTTESSWARPGTVVTFILTMRNNDSAGCSPTSLTATITPPAGWTANPSTITATVNPLGGTNGSGSQVTITLPATLADGDYQINTSVVNTSSGKTASSTSFIGVDTQNPVATIAQPTNTQLPQTGTVTIQANGSDPSRNFNVRTMTISTDGMLRKTCQTSMFQTCSYSWSMNGVNRGYHTITATAVDSAGNVGVSQLRVCYPFNPDGSPGVCSSGGGGIRKIPE